ncbi:MAG: Flp family type IVb pilin [Acidobacteriaceae bacterium]|nr:Flp family type IVb pilin [Acidobacteriaceae bacterium]
MKNMKQLMKNLMTEESGQDLIEYALVAALIGLGSVAAIGKIGGGISNEFNNINNSFSTGV